MENQFLEAEYVNLKAKNKQRRREIGHYILLQTQKLKKERQKRQKKTKKEE